MHRGGAAVSRCGWRHRMAAAPSPWQASWGGCAPRAAARWRPGAASTACAARACPNAAAALRPSGRVARPPRLGWGAARRRRGKHAFRTHSALQRRLLPRRRARQCPQAARTDQETPPPLRSTSPRPAMTLRIPLRRRRGGLPLPSRDVGSERALPKHGHHEDGILGCTSRCYMPRLVTSPRPPTGHGAKRRA